MLIQTGSPSRSKGSRPNCTSVLGTNSPGAARQEMGSPRVPRGAFLSETPHPEQVSHPEAGMHECGGSLFSPTGAGGLTRMITHTCAHTYHVGTCVHTCLSPLQLYSFCSNEPKCLPPPPSSCTKLSVFRHIPRPWSADTHNRGSEGF